MLFHTWYCVVLICLFAASMYSFSSSSSFDSFSSSAVALKRHTYTQTLFVSLYETMTYSAEFQMRNVCSLELHIHLCFRSHASSDLFSHTCFLARTSTLTFFHPHSLSHSLTLTLFLYFCFCLFIKIRIFLSFYLYPNYLFHPQMCVTSSRSPPIERKVFKHTNGNLLFIEIIYVRKI